jgi:hypothetical protein
MNGATSPFIQHCVQGARKFIQTAVVIDNEAVLGAPDKAPEDDTPKRARRDSGSVLTEPTPPETVAPDGEALPAPTQEQSPGADSETTIVTSHYLNAKQLTDAFLAQSVICGLYKPEPGENMVLLSSNAALHADLVIIDWYLEGRSSATAKEIIRNILKADRAENGRLRLLAVYTSEPGLESIALELFDAIEQDPALKGRLAIAENSQILVSSDTRICFFNKPNTIDTKKAGIVAEGDLPERLVSEFAVLTEGVMATFAVSSIAAIRRTAHHLVASFRKELDGAYVAHRCALPDPEDAKEFATDLIAAELRNVISVNEVAENTMSVEILEHWIDHLVNEKSHVFTDHVEAEAPAALVKEFVKAGENAVKDSADKQRRHGDAKAQLSKKKAITCESLGAIFYSDHRDGWSQCCNFARMSTFKREAFGRMKFPANWRPTLTLGSVLKIIRSPDEPADPDFSNIGDYLLCVQPRCDSVRLSSDTAFPFQTAFTATSGFHLVLNDGTDPQTLIHINTKPRDAVMIRFSPDAKSQTVRAVPKPGTAGTASIDPLNQQNRFVFTDIRGRQYLWLADIKDLKAQRDASELAAQLHRVGIDELEWLRRAASGKVRPPGQ